MSYKFLMTKQAKKDLKKLDLKEQKKILKYINDNLLDIEDPYNNQYKELSANLKGYGRYRVGNYRILVEIKNDLFIIRCLKIRHRKEIYK